jgi:hypothetical protein
VLVVQVVQVILGLLRWALPWLGRLLWRYAAYWGGALLSRLVGSTVVSLWQVARLVVFVSALVALFSEVTSLFLQGIWAGVSYYMGQSEWREWWAYLSYLCGIDVFVGILIGWWRYYVIAIIVVWLTRWAARLKWV